MKQIEGLDAIRTDIAALFETKRSAAQTLRDLAEPFAREAVGDQFVDDPYGYLGWDVSPVFADGVLIALDFVQITHDDRGPGRRKTKRVVFGDAPTSPAEARRAAYDAAYAEYLDLTEAARDKRMDVIRAITAMVAHGEWNA